MGGNLSTLSEDELIATLRDPSSPEDLNPKYATNWRSKCLRESHAQLKKDIGNEPLSEEEKKEALFAYHPDSNLLCVYGKNKYGINGALLSQEEEDQHRELWCEHNVCLSETAQVPSSSDPPPSSDEGNPNNNNNNNDTDTLLILVSSSMSSMFVIITFMIILFKKK